MRGVKSAFVSVVGQDDNIGDSVLRRGLLEALRDPSIQLHVHVGDVGAGYRTGLGLRADDVLYTNRSEWFASMRMNRGVAGSSYVNNAGEIMRMKGPRYLGLEQLASFAIMRARGGALVHAGVGIRKFDTPYKRARRNPLRYFDMVAWRDSLSRDHTGVGEVQPDWAFHCERESSSSQGRDTIAVTLRGDREEPSATWVQAVRRLADETGSKIVAFTQVARDDARTIEIGRLLRADEVLSWQSDEHRKQETRIRELFGRSVGVVSDRLHALVIGATEGAYPIGMPPQRSEKLERTLAPVGFATYVATPDSLDRKLQELSTLPSPQGDVERAREQLASRSAQIRTLILDGRKGN